MKEYVLNYYPYFKCIADKCKHSCCVGWEIKIDKETLDKYITETSPYASSLKMGLDFKKSKFRCDKSKRCAFLNDDGLCEIILNLGEDNLCQICTDHPRFRSYFDDRVELGLGFCCEEATRIILSFTGKIQPVLSCDDGRAQPLGFLQKSVLEFRQRALDIVQDRNLDINCRIEKLINLCNANVCEKDFKAIFKLFLSLERLDNSWGKRLKTPQNAHYRGETPSSFSLYFEQFLANGIYRHLSSAEDTMQVRGIMLGLIFSWWTVMAIIMQELPSSQSEFSTVVDVVRAFSSEVEYSQKNLNKLFSFASKFIEI